MTIKKNHRAWLAAAIVFAGLSTACNTGTGPSAGLTPDSSSTTLISQQNSSSVRSELGASAPTPTALPMNERMLVDQEEKLLENIYQRVNPSVVYIEVTEQVSTRRRGSVTVSSSASGFVIDKQGHIVTNDHVVVQATDITVTFSDGKTATAKVVKEDASNDLAVIKVDVSADQLVPVEMADSSQLLPGQRVEAIGNPYGLVGTMTEGIISAVGRALPSSKTSGDSLTKGDIIQTDAAINPGNSGGPLLDSYGYVIGVNTAIELSSSGMGQQTGTGIGFAVPINTVKRVVEGIMGVE